LTFLSFLLYFFLSFFPSFLMSSFLIFFVLCCLSLIHHFHSFCICRGISCSLLTFVAFSFCLIVSNHVSCDVIIVNNEFEGCRRRQSSYAEGLSWHLFGETKNTLINFMRTVSPGLDSKRTPLKCKPETLELALYCSMFRYFSYSFLCIFPQYYLSRFHLYFLHKCLCLKCIWPHNLHLVYKCYQTLTIASLKMLCADTGCIDVTS
jgi:hypothetical protein